MGILALMMVAFGHLAMLDGLLVALWGFAFGLVPVGWSTWLATTVPDEAESAGGLLVASIQLAISAGAAGGGAVFDLNGASGVFAGSGLLLVTAMVIVFMAFAARKGCWPGGEHGGGGGNSPDNHQDGNPAARADNTQHHIAGDPANHIHHVKQGGGQAKHGAGQPQVFAHR
uniref:Uncharacterized protein n=1 Tax=Acyrthosiphon pisum TaxID=7029 RepID=A0A8R2FD23_ACYPI